MKDKAEAKHLTRKKPGADSSPACGSATSTCAGSSSRTTRPTTATPLSWRRPRNAPGASGRSWRTCSSRNARRACSTSRRCPSSITAHAPGYIDRENEVIVGLQTDAPLKRAIMPNGGLRMVLSSLKAYGYEPNPAVVEAFTKYRKTHNEGVFDAYTADIRACRSSHILTGPAGRLRPRTHHRGLPAGRALRRGAADQAKGTGEGRARRRHVHGGRDSRPRGAERADPRAERTAGDGEELRLRHFRAGAHRARSGAMALLRLPRRREGTERRGDVAGPHLDVPRHLLRARPRGRHADRGAGAGDHRRLRHQAADRALPAHARV